MLTLGARLPAAAAAAYASIAAGCASSAVDVKAAAEGGPPDIEEGDFGTLTTTPDVPGEDGEFT